MRKAHRKSRLGCKTCKRRKIKCDEARPECGNCLRFGVNCDFSPIPAARPPAAGAASPPPHRGRPRGDWASWAEQIRVSSAEQRPTTLNVEDLELFYHYLRHTAPSISGGDARDDNIWTAGAPELGFAQHPCVLQLMLGLSALHMARTTRPSDKGRLLALAERHSTAALQAATVLLRQRLDDARNSPALYVISVLVCFTAFARGPERGNLLVVADSGQVSWFSLLRGVRLVVQTTGWDSVFSGPLAKYRPQTRGEEEQVAAEDATSTSEEEAAAAGPPTGNEDWRVSLRNARSLISSSNPITTDAQVYVRELDVLEQLFEKTFGRGRDAAPGTEGTMMTVIHWIYQLEAPFIDALGRGEPPALVILGHFCVLLRTLERHWFVEGWAAHIAAEVAHALPGAGREWLGWPVRFLEAGRGHIGKE